MNLEIDSARLLSEIEALGLISEAEPPVVTRVVFTPADMRAPRLANRSLQRCRAFRAPGCSRQYLRALAGF